MLSGDAPATIGPYMLMQPLGQGAAGAVYLAEHRELKGRQVALKVMCPGVEGGVTDVARFRREAEAAARVTHPNVVRVFDYGEEDGHVYIAMEHAPGQNLKRALTGGGPFEPARAVKVVRQLLAGLGACHTVGLIHRDIKPANIMIDASDEVRILDLGLVRFVARTVLTRPGETVGTPAYMSPEQIRGGDTDARGDVYQVGLVLQECLTGDPAFQADSVPELITKILRGQREPLASGLPALDEFVGRCTATKPDRRFASCDEALAHPALVRVAKRRVSAGRAAAMSPSPAVSDPAGARERRTAAALVALAAGGVLAAACIAWMQRPPAPRAEARAVAAAEPPRASPASASAERLAAADRRLGELFLRFWERGSLTLSHVSPISLGDPADSAPVGAMITRILTESGRDLAELAELERGLRTSEMEPGDMPDITLYVAATQATLRFAVWCHARKVEQMRAEPAEGRGEGPVALEVAGMVAQRPPNLPVAGAPMYRRAATLLAEALARACEGRFGDGQVAHILGLVLNAGNSFWGVDLRGPARSLYERERDQFRAAAERLPGGAGTLLGRAAHALMVQRWSGSGGTAFERREAARRLVQDLRELKRRHPAAAGTFEALARLGDTAPAARPSAASR